MVAAVDTLSSDDDDQILDAIGSWLEGVKPQVRELEQGDIYPEEIVKQMKELGLFFSYVSSRVWWIGHECLLLCKSYHQA